MWTKDNAKRNTKNETYANHEFKKRRVQFSHDIACMLCLRCFIPMTKGYTVVTKIVDQPYYLVDNIVASRIISTSRSSTCSIHATEYLTMCIVQLVNSNRQLNTLGIVHSVQTDQIE